MRQLKRCSDLEGEIKMSIDTMTWLTFLFLALTVIFVLLRKHKMSVLFSVASLVMFAWANWNFLYLAVLSLRDLLFKR